MGYLLLAITLFMISDIETVSAGVSKGLEVCVSSVIPSLIIFFIMSDIILKLNSCKKVSPKWTAFLLGSVCGFPVGAHVCEELYLQGKINENDNQRLLPLCNNTSPAFVIGAIGASMLGDKRLGILLYCSELISAFIFILPIKCKISDKSTKAKEVNLGNLFFSAIEKSVSSMLKICTIICFFSGTLAFVTKHANNSIATTLSIFLEISNGAASCAALFGFKPSISILLLAFLCNWSGICVHMQVLSAQKSIKVKYLSFAVAKFLQGILSSLIALSGYKIFFCT